MEIIKHPEFMISEQHAAEDESAREQYYIERLEAVKEGGVVTIRREFEAETGEVHDVFNKGSRCGFIDYEYGFGCDAYKGDTPGEEKFIGTRETVEQARDLIFYKD